MAKAFYAIRKGHFTGIVDNWDECKKATTGFSNADYKKFSTEEEALAYLNGISLTKNLIEDNSKLGYCTAFTDGSYEPNIDNYSGAYLIITPQGEESSATFVGKKEEYKKYRNVSGEIIAVLNLIKNIIELHQDKVRIYYDYEGIEKWAKNEWEANTELSRFYVSKINEYSDIVEMEFVKVKGHSNNEYNDRVDQMAKNALLGTKVSRKQGDNFVIIKNLLIENFNELLNKLALSTNEKNKYVFQYSKKKAYLTYYPTTNKLMLQGNPKTFAYQIVITYLNEIFPSLDIVKVLDVSYEGKIDVSSIDKIENVIPIIPSDYPENIKNLLKQTMINIKYHFEAIDYSMYVIPACRALEGHIKYMLNKNGLVLEGLKFDCFEKAPSGIGYVVKDKHLYREIIDWDKILTAYNLYHDNRHGISHFGTLVGTYDDTVLMSSWDEANELINKIIGVIRENLC